MHTTQGAAAARNTISTESGSIPAEISEGAEGFVDDLLIGVAEEFAGATRPAEPHYLVAFRLARVFRAADSDPIRFAPAVARFCELQGRDFENFYGGFFIRAFGLVRFPGGANPLTRAWAKGEAFPYPCQPVSPKHKRFVAMCYWLSRTNPERTFFVSRKELLQLAGLESVTVTSFLRFMAGEELIVCVSEDYSYRARKGEPAKSKEFRFVGPDLPPAAYDETEDLEDRWAASDDYLIPSGEPDPAPVAPDVEPEPKSERDQAVNNAPEPTPIVDVEVEVAAAEAAEHVEVEPEPILQVEPAPVPEPEPINRVVEATPAPGLPAWAVRAKLLAELTLAVPPGPAVTPEPEPRDDVVRVAPAPESSLDAGRVSRALARARDRRPDVEAAVAAVLTCHD